MFDKLRETADVEENRMRKDWFYTYNNIFVQPISRSAKFVYIFLCCCADGDSKSFPDHETISVKCDIDIREVGNALNELKGANLISIKNRKGQQGNIYFIHSC